MRLGKQQLSVQRQCVKKAAVNAATVERYKQQASFAAQLKISYNDWQDMVVALLSISPTILI